MKSDRRIDWMSALLGVALVAAVAGCDRGSQPPGRIAPADGASTQIPPAPAASPPAGTTVGSIVDDGVLTAKLTAALLVDPNVRGTEIKVETRRGDVQLSGFAASQSEIDRALTIARNMQGVTSVENKISVKPESATVGNVIDDGIVTTRVRSALLADPRVRSFDIGVVTRKGEVQLSGFVDSQVQIDQAISIAKGVGGVQGIDNKMTVKK